MKQSGSRVKCSVQDVAVTLPVPVVEPNRYTCAGKVSLAAAGPATALGSSPCPRSVSRYMILIMKHGDRINTGIYRLCDH